MFFDEYEKIIVNKHYEKEARKLSAIDTYEGVKIVHVEKVLKEHGETAVCNLASINLSKVNTKDDLERVVPIVVRMLDDVIDLNFYPMKKVRTTNHKTRAIGLGQMGEHEFIANKSIMYGSQEHMNIINNIMETISYNAIKTSALLAQEKGSYEQFEGSDWYFGILPIDNANEKAKELTIGNESVYSEKEWDDLRVEASQGVRNGYMLANAPTSSISILVGTTQASEPVYKRKWFEENLSGLIPVTAPKINPANYQFYKPAFEVDQLDLVRVSAVRQKWICQGQSTNIFISLDKASGKYLHSIYMLAYELGLKSTYYLRSQSIEAEEKVGTGKDEDVVDRSMECSGCQ